MMSSQRIVELETDCVSLLATQSVYQERLIQPNTSAETWSAAPKCPHNSLISQGSCRKYSFHPRFIPLAVISYRGSSGAYRVELERYQSDLQSTKLIERQQKLDFATRTNR
jgi:hypothetical protein